jgi:hypothetical protein
MLFGHHGEQGVSISPAIDPGFPATATEELFHHGQAKAMLFPRGGRQQNPSARSGGLAHRCEARFERMAYGMQAAQPNSDFRKVTNIIFPANTQKPGSWRQQAKINLRNWQAARAKSINESDGVVGITQPCQGREGFDIFWRGGCRVGLHGFMHRVVKDTLR